MKIIALLSLLFLVSSVVACPHDVPEKYADADEQSMMNTFGPSSTLIEAQSNQTIYLQLPSTPGTGYSWDFHSTTSDESKQSLLSCHFKRLDRAVMHNTARLGAGGSEIWQFHVDEKHVNPETQEMTIALAYNRPWMPQDDTATNVWNVKIRR